MEKDFSDIKAWMVLRLNEVDNYGQAANGEKRYVLIVLELIEEVERLRKYTRELERAGKDE